MAESSEILAGDDAGSGQSVQALVDNLQRETRKQQMRFYAVVGLCCIWAITSAILARLGVLAPGWGAASAMPLPLLTAFVLAVPSKRLRAATDALAQRSDLSAVGPMLEYRNHVLPGRTQRALRDALTALLPRLKASDAHLLTRRHRRILNGILQTYVTGNPSRFDPTIRIAVLRALAQVGDEHAVKYVQAVAEMPARSPAQERVKEEAQACLPALQQRPGARAARPDAPAALGCAGKPG